MSSLYLPNSACGIYAIFCFTDQKIYVGRTVNRIEKRVNDHFAALRRNAHCNVHLQLAFNRYSADDFGWHIIELCDESELLDREMFWIRFFNSNSRINGFNLTAGGDGILSPSDEVRQRIGNANRKREISEETRHRMSEAQLGKRLRGETIAKISNSLIGNQRTKGRHLSEEERENISVVHKGKILSEDTKKRMSVSKKGHEVSNETRHKISAAKKGKPSNVGFVPTEETRQKMSEAQKGNKNCVGRILSEETRRKISESLKKRQ